MFWWWYDHSHFGNTTCLSVYMVFEKNVTAFIRTNIPSTFNHITHAKLIYHPIFLPLICLYAHLGLGTPVSYKILSLYLFWPIQLRFLISFLGSWITVCVSKELTGPKILKPFYPHKHYNILSHLVFFFSSCRECSSCSPALLRQNWWHNIL